MGVLHVNDDRFLKPTDEACIQAALDAAVAGDTVLIPRFNRRTGKTLWQIAKALEIPSGVTVLLDNCSMVLATGCYDNMFRNKEHATDFALIGEGNVVLSGGESNYLLETTQGKMGLPDITVNALILFKNASRFTIKGLRFEMARWTSVYMTRCDHGTIENLWFDMIPHIQRLTGVTIKGGCHDLELKNLTGRTGEDCIYILADKKGFGPEEDSSIHHISVRNQVMDANYSSMVHIRAFTGEKIHDVEMDGLVDSSDFFDKRRTMSNICIGTAAADAHPAALGDVYNIHGTNLYSRSVRTMAMDGNLKDSKFENIWTFGDNINMIKAGRTDIAFENVTFSNMYYGKGSTPNNSNSFISRQANGATAVIMGNLTGYTIEKMFLECEEEN